MTRQIFSAEIKFDDAPLPARGKLIAAEHNIKQILARIRPMVEEVYVLATRERFTMCVVHENISPLIHFFHTGNNLNGYVQFYYNSEESVIHLFAAACGLLSHIKGDSRILLEMNRGYQWAAETGCLGITLHHVLNKAIETGKAVRIATGIDQFCSSIMETGLSMVYNKLDDLHNKTFFIVGSGEMAGMALELLCLEGIRNIFLTGTNKAGANQLAEKFGVKLIAIEKVADFISDSDVIIGASHEEIRIASPRSVKKQAGLLTKNKKRFILDFGMPGNFDPRMSEIPQAEMFNLDDLRRLHPSPLESFGGQERAWSMVMKESSQFLHILQMLQHAPVLAAYLSRAFSHKTELSVKLKSTLKNIFRFKRPIDALAGANRDFNNERTLLNNHQPDKPVDVVKHIRALRKIKYDPQDN